MIVLVSSFIIYEITPEAITCKYLYKLRANMDNINLLYISLSAFIAVFCVLTVISIFMRIVLLIFPVKKTEDDAVVYAAISATVSNLFPETKITKIEETK